MKILERVEQKEISFFFFLMKKKSNGDFYSTCVYIYLKSRS